MAVCSQGSCGSIIYNVRVCADPSVLCETWCSHTTFHQVLIPKLKEANLNPNVVTNIVAAVGELAQVGSY